MHPKSFVLVDFENVQPKNLDPLRKTDHLIKIFLGQAQSKLSTEFVKMLLPFGPRVELIRVDGNGNNALDFHIAYFVGRLACEAPGAAIQIVSKDTGFDPLIRYLRKQNIDCTRVSTVQGTSKKTSTNVPATRAVATLPPLAEQIEKVRANFLKRSKTRPQTMKTLRSAINALFQNQMSPAALDEIVAALKSAKFVSDVGGKAVYE